MVVMHNQQHLAAALAEGQETHFGTRGGDFHAKHILFASVICGKKNSERIRFF